MAIANLEGLTHPDDLALAWSRFLVEDLVERREQKTLPLFHGVYTFELDDGTPVVPTVPDIFEFNDFDAPFKIIESRPQAYAYLAVMTGQPVPLTAWTGETGLPAKKQLLGIPTEIIEPGSFTWYFMAVFYSRTKEMVFCGGFDGEKFSQVKCMYGSYGGILADLFRRDA
jgi:hypothetical protein